MFCLLMLPNVNTLKKMPNQEENNVIRDEQINSGSPSSNVHEEITSSTSNTSCNSLDNNLTDEHDSIIDHEVEARAARFDETKPSATQQPIGKYTSHVIGSTAETEKRASVLSVLFKVMDRKINMGCTRLSLLSFVGLFILLLNIVAMVTIVVITAASLTTSEKVHIVGIQGPLSLLIANYYATRLRVLQSTYNTLQLVNQGVFSILYDSSKSDFITDYVNLTSAIPIPWTYMEGTTNSTQVSNAPIFKAWEAIFTLYNISSGGGITPPGNQTNFNNGTSNNNVPPSNNQNQTDPNSNPNGISSFNTTLLKVAQQTLNSEPYLSIASSHEASLFSFRDSLIDLCFSASQTARVSLMVNLVIIGLSLIFIVPFGILVFIIGLFKTKNSELLIQETNIKLLLETMTDDKMKLLFKPLCVSAKMENSFTFLEKTRLYNELCKKSNNYQTITYNLIKTGKQDFVAKNEKKLTETEQEKLHIVFELIESMNPNSDTFVTVSELSCGPLLELVDSFNNKEDEYLYLDIMPHYLVDSVEEEVTVSLLPLHADFKESYGK